MKIEQEELVVTEACNCSICSKEIDGNNLNISVGNIKLHTFKICEACMNSQNIKNDYEEVKTIIMNHLKFYINISKK